MHQRINFFLMKISSFSIMHFIKILLTKSKNEYGKKQLLFSTL